MLSALSGFGVAVYKHSIDSDIKGDTSGDFKKYLVAHLKAERDESPTIDEDQIAEDAERLYSAGKHFSLNLLSHVITGNDMDVTWGPT